MRVDAALRQRLPQRLKKITPETAAVNAAENKQTQQKAQRRAWFVRQKMSPCSMLCASISRCSTRGFKRLTASLQASLLAASGLSGGSTECTPSVLTCDQRCKVSTVSIQAGVNSSMKQCTDGSFGGCIPV